jgi:hypothetical protein
LKNCIDAVMMLLNMRSCKLRDNQDGVRARGETHLTEALMHTVKKTKERVKATIMVKAIMIE